MKRIFRSLMVTLMGLAFLSSVSATPLHTKVAFKGAPAKAAAPSAPSSKTISSVPSGPTIAGAYGLDGMIKVPASKDMSILFGGSMTTSGAAGAATQFRLTVLGHQDIAGHMGPAKPHWLAGIQYTSNSGNVPGTNILGATFGWGVTVPLASNLSFIADVNLLQYGGISGTGFSFTTWTLLAPAFGVFYTF